MGKIKELENKILYHNNLYWNENKSEISDIEYDSLVRQLKNIDPNNFILSKTYTDEKIQHKYPMTSLDKVYSIKELLEWCTKVARDENELFIIQPKYDGCTGELYNGRLCTTKKDVTSKVPSIHNIDSDVYIKGEIIIRKSDFEKNKDILIKSDGKPYKTPRNACAGILNNDKLDSSIYDLLELVPFDSNLWYKRSLKKLKELDWDEMIKIIQGLNYPTDGLVVKLANKEYSDSLGSTSHHPRGEMALKFTNPTAESILRNVTWQSGKRKLTPVGQIDPVEIGGVTVSNVNLHNYKYIKDKDIHINDILVIERSGDVIPNVQKVIPRTLDRKNIELYYCPVCDCPVDYRKPELYCTNRSCEGKLLVLLYDSVVRLGIENLGKPTIQKLITTVIVRSAGDILELTKEDILKLDGFKEKSAQNLFNEIQKPIKDGVYDWQILASLNIEGVGNRMSKILLTNKSFEQIQNTSINEFESIEGVGHKMAVRIRQGIAGKRNYIYRLLSTLKIKEKKLKKSKTICFTGKMEEKRSYYEAMAESCGYEVVKSVTKDLTVLICADINGNSSKIKKARKMKIDIRTMI